MAAVCALWAADALAHSIPWVVVPLAASPLVAVVLSGALGILRKSWWVALGNTALVTLWVGWFLIASMYAISDLVIWAPVAALGLHLLVLLSSIVWSALRRSRPTPPTT